MDSILKKQKLKEIKSEDQEDTHDRVAEIRSMKEREIFMKNTGFSEGIGTKDIQHIKDEVASRK